MSAVPVSPIRILGDGKPFSWVYDGDKRISQAMYHADAEAFRARIVAARNAPLEALARDWEKEEVFHLETFKRAFDVGLHEVAACANKRAEICSRQAAKCRALKEE